MKDPAFPFYAQDFLTGVMHFSMAERGMFITLLSYQWAHGKIPLERLGLILGSGWETHWVAVKDKFIEADKGYIINVRLEDERFKRARFKEKQSENGKKGGRKPKDTPTAINFDENPAITQIQNQKKPLENEDEYENESIIENEKGKEGTGEKPLAAARVVYPFDSADFAQQWQAWKQYRATEHRQRYRSIESEQAALAELGTLSALNEQTAIAIMHQSMGKGWKGFFEIKTDGATAGATKSRVRYSDDFRRKIADRLRSG